MPFLEYQQQIELTAGGGTANLPVAESYKAYSVVSTGSVTLLANWTIQASGTPLAGHKYFFNYNANITLDGNDINFFGTNLPENLENENCVIIAYYDGSAWTVHFLPSADSASNSAIFNYGRAAVVNAGASANLLAVDGVDSVTPGYVMPAAGFIKSIGIGSEVTGTGNNGVATVYINGVATAFTTALDASAAGIITPVGAAPAGLTVDAGDRVGVDIENVAGGPTSFSNTTASLRIQLI
jgi:hypothetical protein